MKKFIFDVGSLIIFYEGACFGEVCVVASDTEEGVKIHGVIYKRERGGGMRNRVVDRCHCYLYFPIVWRGSKKKKFGSTKEERVSVFVAHTIRATSQ